MLEAGGKLVTPGLIDLHSHVFPYGSAIGIPADELVASQCTTTCVSAGDAGANNFAAFRRHVVGQSRTRLYAFVHIANIGLAGFPVPELYNIDFARVDEAARTVAENADMVLGIKVRMSENVIAKHGLEPLKRAIIRLREGGHGAKVMCHIGGVETRELMSQILDLLRPGDILTHAYIRRAQSRRRLHQYRAGRQAAAGGARRQAARRGLRRRPRRRQLRLHGGRAGDRARGAARHHLLRHPRLLRQLRRACPISPG